MAMAITTAIATAITTAITTTIKLRYSPTILQQTRMLKNMLLHQSSNPKNHFSVLCIFLIDPSLEKVEPKKIEKWNQKKFI